MVKFDRNMLFLWPVFNDILMVIIIGGDDIEIRYSSDQ
jgi:hypothetical protein